MNQEEIRDLLYDLKQFTIIYDDNQEMILDNEIPNNKENQINIADVYTRIFQTIASYR
ncbi:hypothetical protein J41TS4_14430 [Paenibacillus apis]|uniref:Uncharacterized protein n=1 Tax=Paenibacillus apis TaxID=1792174 RepID=A0A919Y3E1_9BACL|nr:hypothetical protein J41TS4_14430 [Paenibacillus apis]